MLQLLFPEMERLSRAGMRSAAQSRGDTARCSWTEETATTTIAVVFQSGSMRTFNIAKAAPGTLILLSDQLVAVEQLTRFLSGQSEIIL
jgi:hypothetical protein